MARTRWRAHAGGLAEARTLVCGRCECDNLWLASCKSPPPGAASALDVKLLPSVPAARGDGVVVDEIRRKVGEGRRRRQVLLGHLRPHRAPLA
eukprot:7382657-Prymnesium_polylepis.1